MEPSEDGAVAPASRRGRLVAAISLVCLLVYVGALTASMITYAGGSWADRYAKEFDIVANYWCDLMEAEAVNGEPSRLSAAFANTAFTALALSLGLCWWAAASVMPRSGLARWGTRIGAISAILVAAVMVVPYGTHPWAHAATTLSAGGLGFLATIFIAIATFRLQPRAWVQHSLAGALLVIAIVHIFVYAKLLAEGSEGMVLPVIQKIATLILVMWMFATLIGVLRQRDATA